MSDLPPMEIYTVADTPQEVELAVLKVVNADGFLVSTNNLSDIDNAEVARQNLGIVGGVKPDWDAAPGSSAEILNKPDLGTAAAANTEDFATAAQGELAESALQSSDIGVMVQPYDADTVIDPNYNQFSDSEKTKLEGIQSGAQVNPDLSDYVTESVLTTALSGKQDSGDYLVAEDLPDLSDYVTESELTTALSGKQNSGDYLTPSSLSNYETTTQLNSRDTANRNRANHTGTQSINTISGLETALQTGRKETIILALTAPATNIVLGEILAINAFPYAMTITSVRADVAVAPTGSNLLIDMRKNGVSMMTNRFVIETSETSSTTATIPPSLSSNSLAIGDRLSFNVDQIGATVPGQYLVITIEGERV